VSLLEKYVHLRYVVSLRNNISLAGIEAPPILFHPQDVSNNHLTDVTVLGQLPHLLVMKADHNQLSSALLPELKYLQIASFSHNLITSTEDIAQPVLETLNLACESVTGSEPDQIRYRY